MERKEIISRLEKLKSLIEWDLPLDYQIVLDEAIKLLSCETLEVKEDDWVIYHIPEDFDLDTAANMYMQINSMFDKTIAIQGNVSAMSKKELIDYIESREEI
jgi:hypothetical protein